jgi:transcriptional regulator with XRE-family HTH domain
VRQEEGSDNEGPHVLREDGAMVDGSPTAPARRLGRELKRLRDATGKTQAEVADYAGTYSTTISKIETGERTPPLSVLKLMLQLYEVDAAHRETLIQLAQQAKVPGWWADYGEGVPSWFTAYVRDESAASEVQTFEALYVPGLLQTTAYAAAAGLSEESTHVRTTRQQRLAGATPLVLRAVLDEAALHRQVGGPEVMREQISRLRNATSQPNITVQVVPFSAGAHPGMTGPFTILRFPEPSMDVVFVEQRGGAIYLDRPVDVDVHAASFRRLADLALSDDDTVSLLNEMERRYQR